MLISALNLHCPHRASISALRMARQSRRGIGPPLMLDLWDIFQTSVNCAFGDSKNGISGQICPSYWYV